MTPAMAVPLVPVLKSIDEVPAVLPVRLIWMVATPVLMSSLTE